MQSPTSQASQQFTLAVVHAELHCLLVIYKVSVPRPVDLAWGACSMTHLETHFPMQQK
jgi:hypothetical protein